MKKIAVLLSTYNGAKWLTSQMDSIVEQRNVNLRLIVRDDKSKDESLNLIKQYSGKIEMEICTDTNEKLGPGRSFWHLLKHVKDEDFIAFCDQDDIWLNDKLHAATKNFEKNNDKPIVYASAIQIFKTQIRHPRRFPNLSFSNSLSQNQMMGCTIVFNKAFLNIIKDSHLPSSQMHDSWIYSLATCQAECIFDLTPRILYRVHESNDTGIFFFSSLRKQGLLPTYHRFKKHYSSLEKKWRALTESPIICDVHKKQAQTLLYESCGNFLTKLKFISINKIRHSRSLHNLMFWFLFISRKH